VTSLLRRRNHLKVHIRSAWQFAKSQEKRYGRLKCWNGDPCRLYIRKAAIHFGWDFGPASKQLMAGMGRVHLKTYVARIVDL
jgi:hypothetical protein